MSQGDGPERDNRSGRYTTEYELEVFVEAVETLGVSSTRDIADKVGCSYDLAYRRLNQLAEEGEVEGNKFGNTYLWTPAD
jgi:transposase